MTTAILNFVPGVTIGNDSGDGHSAMPALVSHAGRCPGVVPSGSEDQRPGIAIDRQLVESAIQMDMRSRVELTEQMQKLTCLEDSNPVQQMKKWLAERDVLTESLDKSR